MRRLLRQSNAEIKTPVEISGFSHFFEFFGPGLHVAASPRLRIFGKSPKKTLRAWHLPNPQRRCTYFTPRFWNSFSAAKNKKGDLT
ncbi:MAG TPA: hypothetical protein VFB70_19890, partial [Pyrinomonadaceae bacterium]|nr:hypothetical protein [Pyrinomonadaceae bacterium]